MPVKTEDSHFSHFANKTAPFTRMMLSLGVTRTQDAMPLAWTLLLDQALSGWSISVRDNKAACAPKPHQSFLKGVPSWVFDQHTGIGRKALALMAEECLPFAKFFYDIGIADHEARTAALGSIHFRVEATQLDQVLIYDGSDDIYDLCETARFRYRGIPPDAIQYARDLMQANLHILDHYRNRIAGLTHPLHVMPQGVVPTTSASYSVAL